MRSTMITAVGIDISKKKSTVAVRRPGGEIVIRPFEVRHTSSDLKRLAATLKQLGGDIRVVMEHTGNYWRPVALTLKKAGFYVSVVNAIIFVIANCRPLFGFSVYITAFQTEHHHIICPLKKSNITFPAHAAFAMQKPNKLLFHLPATTRAYLV